MTWRTNKLKANLTNTWGRNGTIFDSSVTKKKKKNDEEVHRWLIITQRSKTALILERCCSVLEAARSL